MNCVINLGYEYLPWPSVFCVFPNLCSSCSLLSTGGKMEVSHKHNNGENDSINFCNAWIHSSSHHSPAVSEQHKYPRLNAKSIEQMWNIQHLKTNHYISLPFLNVANKSQSLQHDILHNIAPLCTKCPCVIIIYQGNTMLSRLAS